jgi:hypothetical protein
VLVPCFLLFFCCFSILEKLHRKYSRNWMKQKPNLLIFTKASRSLKRRRRRATGWPHHRAAWPAPGPCPLWVRPPWPTSDAVPSPIKTPWQEKPKHPDQFSRNTSWSAAVVDSRSGGGPEALLGTLPERGIATGGLLHRHACLRCDEWVVYLGLWVHSSS